MKAFAAKSILILCTAVLLLACNKEDDPAPAPVPTPDPEMHPVAQVLEGNYWQEKICFTYKGKGSNTIKITKDIIEEFTLDGSVRIDERLDIFYVAPETGKVHAYEFHQSYIGNWYYRNLYSLEYLSDNRIRVNTDDEYSAYYGADSNIELRVVSCTDREIVLDGPIKPYIWQNWRLDYEYEMYGLMYLGIRVYWTKIENGAEILEPSSPLD